MVNTDKILNSLESFLRIKGFNVSNYYKDKTIPCPACQKYLINSREETEYFATFNEDKTVFKCSKCGVTGNIIDAYRHIENNQLISEKEILTQIAKMFQISLGINSFNLAPLKELIDKDFPPDTFIVNSLLKPGLCFLSGDPKVGKSWFVLQLALAISSGEPFLNFKTEQGTVLYLALEDTYKRVVDRVESIGYKEKSLNKLILQGENSNDDDIYSFKPGFDFENFVPLFVEKYPDTKLIIIDTFQKIRALTSSSYSYSNDYEETSKLKKLADKYGIAIILVHHNRKQETDNPINKISGTNALAGCADIIFILTKPNRLENKGNLMATGRDIETRDLPLIFVKDNFLWKIDDDYQKELFEIKEEVIKILISFMENKKSWSGTPTDFFNILSNENKMVDLKSVNSMTRKIKNNETILINNGILFRQYKSGNRILEFVNQNLLN